MNLNKKEFTTCQNPDATKEQQARWDRMVRDLEKREQEEHDAKHRKYHST